MSETYPINEIFLSVQGEGFRAGTLNVFVRFAGCNQTCSVGTHGFDCDTEFVSNRTLTALEIMDEVKELWPGCGDFETPDIIFTGGEPLLHVDDELMELVLDESNVISFETNGSLPLPELAVPDDNAYVACSPKVAEHAIKLQRADELRYVRNSGQTVPAPKLQAQHRYVSPAWLPWGPDPKAVQACLEIVRADPSWRLSVQMHKLWSVE